MLIKVAVLALHVGLLFFFFPQRVHNLSPFGEKQPSDNHGVVLNFSVLKNMMTVSEFYKQHSVCCAEAGV